MFPVLLYRNEWLLPAIIYFGLKYFIDQPLSRFRNKNNNNNTHLSDININETSSDSSKVPIALGEQSEIQDTKYGQYPFPKVNRNENLQNYSYYSFYYLFKNIQTNNHYASAIKTLLSPLKSFISAKLL